MKKIVLFGALLLMVSSVFAQNNLTPAKIVLKNGDVINVYNFAQNDCSSKDYFEKYILLKGKYEGEVTEVKDYTGITKIELRGFEADPVLTGDHETGDIAVYKSNGVAVTLKDATLTLSCYGHQELKNQLKVQMLNPINDKVFDKPVDLKNINYILFE